MVEVSRQGVGGEVADDARGEHEDDRRDDRATDGAVHRPGLAGDALRFVVDVVSSRSAALDVRRHPVFASLGQRRQGNSELPRDRHEGDERGEPGAAAQEPVEANEHIHLSYGQATHIASSTVRRVRK